MAAFQAIVFSIPILKDENGQGSHAVGKIHSIAYHGEDLFKYCLEGLSGEGDGA